MVRGRVRRQEGREERLLVLGRAGRGHAGGASLALDRDLARHVLLAHRPEAVEELGVAEHLAAHHAEVDTGEAERRVVECVDEGYFSGEDLLPWLNRVSDVLFVLARSAEDRVRKRR